MILLHAQPFPFICYKLSNQTGTVRLNALKFGYEHQYVRNVLQINSGTTNEGHPVFSDVGFMAGVYQTDWSWCPLVVDFDNDGLRDLVITNGLPRDVTDLDYISYDNDRWAVLEIFRWLSLIHCL